LTTFAFRGADADHVYFECPSRSRPGRVHTVWVDKRTGLVHCSCEDATYRQKSSLLLDPFAAGACRHGRAFAVLVGPVIAKALGRAS